jgi:predicted DNA-binding protein (UPF0251 family)
LSRPEKYRYVEKPPLMRGYKPIGIQFSKVTSEILSFEEYESIRLVEYENMQQKEAAQLMKVSRPTLTRIYNRAIRKVATAFIEGKSIIFDGGNYKLNNEWYRCKKCHSLIEGNSNINKCEICFDADGSE